jgi:hypothetical protein
MLLRSRCALALLATATLLAAAAGVACSSFSSTDDPASVDGGGGPNEGGSVTPEGGALPDASVVNPDGSAPCSTALPFIDDFEGRATLAGCWDGLTKSGLIGAGSTAELAALTDGAGHVFRVNAQPVDGGLGGGAIYLTKTLAVAVPVPVQIGFTWSVEQHPNGDSTGIKGLYAVEIGYQYKSGAFVQGGLLKLAFGLNLKMINPYLSGNDAPVIGIATGVSSERAIVFDAMSATFSIKGRADATRTFALPKDATEVAVTSVKLGVTEVGSLQDAWLLSFDNVSIGKP